MSPLQLILLSSSYSGTYWSYDACFTPARTDQLCQLVVAEGRTKCNTLSGTGRREVATSCRYLWCFHELLFLLFLLIKSIPPAAIWLPSNHNVVFFKSKRKNLCPHITWQVCCCSGKAVSYHSGHPTRKESRANVSFSAIMWGWLKTNAPSPPWGKHRNIGSATKFPQLGKESHIHIHIHMCKRKQIFKNSKLRN